MLARYTSSGYLLSDQLDPTQRSNAGLLRSALLKRLELSPHALRSTLRTLEATHEAFIAALDRGWVLTGDALRDWVSAESDDLETVLSALEAEHGSDDAMAAAIGFHLEELRFDVVSDLALIRSLGALAEQVCAEEERKATRLIAELESIAIEARRADPHGRGASDRRKLIVFSTYSDTVSALHDAVVAAVLAAPAGSPLSDYQGRIAAPVMGAYK
ncbi:MAG: helicase, partial [Actinobacteria bacterium]|nr:helicase [Actinomycetota bacterium]